MLGQERKEEGKKRLLKISASEAYKKEFFSASIPLL